MKKYLLIGIIIGTLGIGVGFFLISNRTGPKNADQETISTAIIPTLEPTGIPTHTPTKTPPPEHKELNNSYHVYQTFNNCGPAALSMALSYYDIHESQQTLGQHLRPYQIANGDNDDKSVTLDELAEEAKNYNLVPYHRPNGNAELMKQLIGAEIPVITRTLLTADDDIGHYRVIKGYNDITKTFLQDDSLQGPNLSFTYADFEVLWQHFNYEYLVLVPKDRQRVAEAILGENTDEHTAWVNAAQRAKNQYEKNPNDIFARFNHSVALYHIGKYKESIIEFEAVQAQLPFRHLWYQIEPILAYYETEKYETVFEITDKILNNQNRAFSELYIIRGRIYEAQGNTEAARKEFEKAVFYNKNLKTAQETLASISNK